VRACAPGARFRFSAFELLAGPCMRARAQCLRASGLGRRCMQLCCCVQIHHCCIVQ
jgi:hypothetical protein